MKFEVRLRDGSTEEVESHNYESWNGFLSFYNVVKYTERSSSLFGKRSYEFNKNNYVATYNVGTWVSVRKVG